MLSATSVKLILTTDICITLSETDMMVYNKGIMENAEDENDTMQKEKKDISLTDVDST